MSKPETMSPAFSLCSDCAWPDACGEDDRCTRARLTLLGFDTGMNVATAFEILGDTSMMSVDGGYSTLPPSAIIEPPTQAELHGEGIIELDACQQPLTARDFHRSIYAGEFRVAKVTLATPARAQIRAAIDEIGKAQKQITPAFEAECFLDAGPAKIEELERDIRTAASVLEALPEAVAQHFGLTIRGACAECGTTLFREEPYTSNAAGKPTCETHADPEAA